MPESSASQIKHRHFSSNESAEFIDFDEGAVFVLWWACGECWGNLNQQARVHLVKNPANSHPHSSKLVLQAYYWKYGSLTFPGV